MATATATVKRHENGRLIIDLAINGQHYGDYPLPDEAEGQLMMLLEDCKDYEVQEIKLIGVANNGKFVTI